MESQINNYSDKMEQLDDLMQLRQNNKGLVASLISELNKQLMNQLKEQFISSELFEVIK